MLVAIDGEPRGVPIGQLIDRYMPPAEAGRHDVVAVTDLECVGVSPTEEVEWTRVTHVSRHPANGDMVTVTTKHGRTVRATASHSFLVRVANRVVARPGRDLVVGDSMPHVKETPAHATGTLPEAPALASASAELIPGVDDLIRGLLDHAPPGDELRGLMRATGATAETLLRCREHAVASGAPQQLVDELDQAINADVWWDPIVDIQVERDSREMVYDFTVDKRLQSFMLTNGVFVHNTLNT